MNSAEQDEEAEGSVTDHELVSGKQAVSSKSITSEESDQTSEISTSEDKLIGSPGMSPISSSSTNMDCDHVLDIPANENDFLKNENNSNNQNSKNNNTSLPKLQTDMEESDNESDISTVDFVNLAHLKRMMKRIKSELESERVTVRHLRAKLTQINKDKLGQTSQFNDEMSLLKCENVALQARAEEQAVYTEQLEYELAKTRKKHKQDLSYSEQREAQDLKQIDDLKSRLSEVKSKLEKLEEENSKYKQEHAEEMHNLKLELESNGNQIVETKKEIEISRAENVRLTEFIKEQEQILKEMLEKIQLAEKELTAEKSEKSRVSDELSVQQALSQEQESLLQEAQSKCQSLTAKLESVSAMHAESEHNFELLESKSIQLECSLNSEKSVSSELRDVLEKSRLQLSELEEKYNHQCRELSEANHSLTKSEKELSTLKKQLQMEKEDKRDLVNKLKKQLDVHQEHVRKLKAEVSATTKHQKYIEEISQKIVRDLQPIFNDFPSEIGNTTPNQTPRITSEDQTRTVLDTLHNTVSKYKSRFNSLTDEKMKAKAECDSLTKESASYKEMLYEKEQAYDECQAKLSEVTREMEKVSLDSTEVEAKCATMTVDLETARVHNQTLQSQCHSLNQELVYAKARYDKDSDEKRLYLQHIYNLLTSELDLTSIIQGQIPSQEKLTWSELCTTVSERLSSLLTEITHLREKVARLSSTLTKNESYMENMRQEHDHSISDLNTELATAIERNSEQWREERDRLEQHYTNMMNENLARQQIYKDQLEKSQKNAEEAWGKLRDSDEVNQSLECNKVSTQEKLLLLEQKQKSLLCALALVTGCYFPLLSRSRQLIEQRALLLRQVSRFDAFKSQVHNLLQTLASESQHSPSPPPLLASSARLRFRKAVLVVLAAHRLQKTSTKPTICLNDGTRQGNLLCWATGDYTENSGNADSQLVQWMCHADLESIASLCTKDIIDTMQTSGEDGCRSEYLVSVVSSCISKLTRQLSALYQIEEPAVMSPYKHLYSSKTLAANLLLGLQSSLAKSHVENDLSVLPARSLVTRLQENVLNFVQQLHSSESERKRLKESVESLSNSRQQLQHCQGVCEDLEGQLNAARQQMEHLVPATRLEEMMSELHQALDREKQSQRLLSDQSLQVKELTRQLNCEASDRSHNEQSVKFAMKTLHDELDGKVSYINSLSRQISSLEGERQSLRDNIYDAENALKIAANDRQSLLNYVETMITAFTKCREDKTGKADISRVMLSGELIPPGHSSPHLLSVQKLAHEFVNAYTTLQAKIAALNTVTTEQLHETSRLKQELSLVCSNQHRNNSQQEYHPSSGYSSMSPLKMSSGNPLSVRHSPATLDMRLSSQATQDIKQLHSDNSSSYPTKLSKLSPSRGRHSPRLLMEGNVRR